MRLILQELNIHTPAIILKTLRKLVDLCIWVVGIQCFLHEELGPDLSD